MTNILYTIILAGTLFFATPSLYAQSLQQLVEALPQALHPFGEEAAVKRLFKIPIGIASTKVEVPSDDSAEQDTMYSKIEKPTQIFTDSDFTVVKRNDYILLVTWQDGSEMSFRKLAIEGGYLLALVRSVKEPFAISTLNLYDKSGQDVSRLFSIPRLDGSLFAPKEATPRQRQLMAVLPVQLSFSDGKKPLLGLSLSSENILPLEEHEEIKALLSPAPIKLQWNRKGFILIQ